jgi:uncharacterized membrane protein YeaQ/YmgE (transglycosylase-associated protein family)
MNEPTTGVLGMSLVLLVLLILLSGLITGALARWVLPGPDPMSWGKTIAYGVGGSIVGGLVWQLVARAVPLPEPTSFVFSVAGAAWLIWLFRRRGAAPPPA